MFRAEHEDTPTKLGDEEVIAITGANGKLGQFVVRELLEDVPASQVVAAVRNPEKASGLQALGVQVREADYNRPETLVRAFQDVEKLLLISGVEPDSRVRQHKAVIDAAKQTGVKLIAYTSILRADTSSLILAGSHKQTEDDLKTSGVDYVLLRNGWYLENHTEALAPALTHGAVIGSAGEGRFAAATRADYASAAATVLTQPGHANKTYELAGDQSYSMREFAEELSKQAARSIAYNNLTPSDYEAALLSFGLPKMIVNVIVDADVKSALGELDDTGHHLSTLLGKKQRHLLPR